MIYSFVRMVYIIFMWSTCKIVWDYFDFLWFHFPNANIYVSVAYCQCDVLFCTHS